MPTAKVVILNWNGREHLGTFLPSVVANTPEDVEVVVADNGSTDDSAAFLQKKFPTVKVLRLDQNYGYAGGYNRALSDEYFDDTDLLILLNSDVETPAGWCGPLVGRMAAEPDIASLSPKILSYTDKSRFEYAGACGGFIDRFGYPFCRGRILSRVEEDRGQYDDARNVFWASGACFVVRRDVFRELGGFDEDFFAHMEEIDFCWRAQLKGWRIAVEPSSSVYHLGAGTLAAESPRKVYLNYRNNLAMLYKNLPSDSFRWILVSRMLLDGFAGLLYLLTGKFKYLTALRDAHNDYRKMIPDLKLKRREIQAGKVAEPQGIYKGSIVLRYLFGRRKFGNMMKKNASR